MRPSAPRISKLYSLQLLHINWSLSTKRVKPCKNSLCFEADVDYQVSPLSLMMDCSNSEWAPTAWLHVLLRPFTKASPARDDLTQSICGFMFLELIGGYLLVHLAFWLHCTLLVATKSSQSHHHEQLLRSNTASDSNLYSVHTNQVRIWVRGGCENLSLEVKCDHRCAQIWSSHFDAVEAIKCWRHVSRASYSLPSINPVRLSLLFLSGFETCS